MCERNTQQIKRIFFLFCVSLWQVASSQSPSSILCPDSVPYVSKDKPTVKWHQTNAFRISAAPVILIGYGISTIGNNGLFLSSNEVKQWRQKNFSSFKTDIDDHMPSIPIAVMYVLDLAGVKHKNNWVSQTIVFGIANALNGFLTDQTKRISHIQRPDDTDHLSFPSAHTTSAFLAAEILHQEFKEASIWISIAGYTFASSVAALRILNNKHWLSDVAAGAGIGIFSAKITYFAFNWIQKKICERRKNEYKRARF
jgi:hypothetical protein